MHKSILSQQPMSTRPFLQNRFLLTWSYVFFGLLVPLINSRDSLATTFSIDPKRSLKRIFSCCNKTFFSIMFLNFSLKKPLPLPFSLRFVLFNRRTKQFSQTYSEKNYLNSIIVFFFSLFKHCKLLNGTVLKIKWHVI